MATVFCSHVQSQPLSETLENEILVDDEEMWLDYGTLRQRGNDFKAAHIAIVITHIRNTKAIEDDDMQYFSRAFCILELAVTPNSCLSINHCQKRKELESTSCSIFGNITLTEGDHVRVGSMTKTLSSPGTLTVGEDTASWVTEAQGQVAVRVETAKCRKQDDLQEVHRFVKQNGGFATVNARVNRALRLAGAHSANM